MSIEAGLRYKLSKGFSINASYYRGFTEVYRRTQYVAKWNSIALGLVYELKGNSN